MPRAIGELIPRVIRQATKRHRAIHRIQRRWDQLVGKDLAAHTRPVSLQRGKLYVHTDEPGASFTLSLEKPRLLKRLQAVTGQQIEEIVVRAGELC